MMTIIFLSPISKSNFHHLVFGRLFKGGFYDRRKGDIVGVSLGQWNL